MTASGSGRKGTVGPQPEIPDKLYFRIGEAARLLDLAPYVLRFWESEFPQLKPNKGGTGQRLYRRRDVEMALRIRRLLYEEGYTISGARQLLKQESRTKEPQLALRIEPREDVKKAAQLREMQAELKELANLLERPLTGARRINAPLTAARVTPASTRRHSTEKTSSPDGPLLFPEASS